MRLTIINQFYRPDVAPTGHLAASLAEHRAQVGDNVTVVTSKGGYVAPVSVAAIRRFADATARMKPCVIRIWTPQLGKGLLVARLLDYLFFYVKAIWCLFTLPPQDIVVSLTTPPYIAWAAVLHKFLHRRTKVVLWNMDCYPDVAERAGLIRRGGLLSRALRAVNRLLFRRIDHLVCLDRAMLELLCTQYASPTRIGESWPPATVIPNWEDLALFPASIDSNGKALIRKNPDEVFVILYLGNTGVGHAFDTVLDAAEVLKASGDRVQFRLIGGGSRWNSIAREVQQRSLDNVHLSGYVPKEQTPTVMASADAALITLRDEALGVMSPSKLHSNLAMGLPIIYVGPAESNVDEAITRFGCGAGFRNGDAAGLVRFIRKLAAKEDCYGRMRRAARRSFEEAYCDRSTLPQFDRLFGRLCSLRRLNAKTAAVMPVRPPPCQCSNT
jgi:putative colanic acid biosynthesis glycosyltransferase WcaI